LKSFEQDLAFKKPHAHNAGFNLEAKERQWIADAMHKTGGNKTRLLIC